MEQQTPLIDDRLRKVILQRAKSVLGDVYTQLDDCGVHLEAESHIGALGALAGVSQRVAYVESLLQLVRDLGPAGDLTQLAKGG